MSPERSCFEHKGIPLSATENAGRVPERDAPWLQSFVRRPAVNAEERKPFLASPEFFPDSNNPEDASPASDTVSRMKSEDGNAAKPEPDMILRRSVAGNAASTHGPINPLVAGSRSSATPEIAKGKAGFSATGNSGDSPAAAPGALWNKTEGSSLEVLPGDRAKTPRGNAPQLTATTNASPAGTANKSQQPHVTIQKHLTIQTELPPTGRVTSVNATEANSSPAGINNGQIVESPMAFSGAGATEFRDHALSPTPLEGLLSAASEGSRQVRRQELQTEPVRMQMSGSKLMRERVTVVMPVVAGARDNKGPQELLERLDHGSPQQQHGGRRVQIRNLHITVQKPAAPQLQPLPQPTLPAPAAAESQTFFNPWERHLSAFD